MSSFDVLQVECSMGQGNRLTVGLQSWLKTISTSKVSSVQASSSVMMQFVKA